MKTWLHATVVFITNILNKPQSSCYSPQLHWPSKAVFIMSTHKVDYSTEQYAVRSQASLLLFF